MLLTVFLVFTRDPYPDIRRVALEGLSNCVVSSEDCGGMMEGCFTAAVELLFDMEHSVRRSAVRAVSLNISLNLLLSLILI